MSVSVTTVSVGNGVFVGTDVLVGVCVSTVSVDNRVFVGLGVSVGITMMIIIGSIVGVSSGEDVEVGIKVAVADGVSVGVPDDCDVPVLLSVETDEDVIVVGKIRPCLNPISPLIDVGTIVFTGIVIPNVLIKNTKLVKRMASSDLQNFLVPPLILQ